MIDFESGSTELVLNPRLPAREAERLRSIARNLPPLERHVWVTTSGSSGALKLVALSKDAILASAAAVNRHLDARSGDVWCSPLPDFHVGGLGIHARARLSSSRVVGLPSWSAPRFAALSEAEGVTLSALVPAQVSDLATANLRAPSALRAIVIGGGALPPALYQAARALGWPLLPSYGMTEACSQVATAAVASLQDERFPDLEVLSHLAVRVTDGRLAVRGGSLLTGYGIEEGGRARFVDPKQHGWFVSEDAADVWTRGTRTFVRPLGRSSDFIKIGGESSSLARLQQIAESAAQRFGADAAVLSIPHERLGAVIHLAVSERSVASDVRRAYDEDVLPFERARAVHVVPIPRSPLGKVQREELRKTLIGDR
ncbi:MAG TPA: AMP-binding protein [Thermoanaerobaculia bacterium]